MNAKDSQLLNDSLLIVADGIVATCPPLSIAWGLSKALYGAGLKLRQQRALEWVELVRDNPTIFTKTLLEQEEFQDGFVYALEKYLTVRSETKRVYLRNMFLGFSESKNKSDFELEILFQILSQLTNSDLRALEYVDTKRVTSYQLFDDMRHLENVYHLIALGIIYNDPSEVGGDSPRVYTSDLGARFIKYLKYGH